MEAAARVAVEPAAPTLATVREEESLRLFITRSPCIKPTDGRMLPLVTEKPEGMPHATWLWLLGLPFGAVLFSTAGRGVPLPSTVADGDLDGDLYMVCWDPTILEHITPRPLPASVGAGAAAEGAPEAVDISEAHSREATDVLVAEDTCKLECDETWLEQVQAHLTDVSKLGERRLTGRLYKQMEKRQVAHGMDDPDALALGAAFVQSLERPKHGKAIRLPARLHHLVLSTRPISPTRIPPESRTPLSSGRHTAVPAVQEAHDAPGGCTGRTTSGTATSEWRPTTPTEISTTESRPATPSYFI